MVSTDQLIPVGFVALFVLIGLLILAGGIGRLRAWWRGMTSASDRRPPVPIRVRSPDSGTPIRPP